MLRMTPIFGNHENCEPYELRPLMELHALRGVGAILDKKQWWIKWQQRPEVRAKWLQEIAREYVERTFSEILRCWPTEQDRFRLKERCVAAMETADADDRHSALSAVCAEVLYMETWKDEDQDDEMDEEDDDEEAQASPFYGDGDHDYIAAIDLLEKADVGSLQQLRRLNPYGQVGWYMHQWSRLRRVRALVGQSTARPVTLLDLYRIFAGDVAEYGFDSLTEQVLARMTASEALEAEGLAQRLSLEYAKEAADVVLAMRFDGGLSVSSLYDAIGNETEIRDDVLHSLLQYMAMIHAELDAVQRYIIECVDEAVAQSGFSPEATAEGVNPERITFGPVEEVFLSDSMVSQELKTKLIRAIRKLEDVPEDQKDWHPRADDQVLDLIHPSLYCGVFNETKQANIALQPGEDMLNHFRRLLASRTARTTLTNPFVSSRSRLDQDKAIKFQWLPSEFDVDASGGVQIRSYINNLHPEDHHELYEAIREVFSRMEPLFQRTLSCLAGSAPPGEFEDVDLERENKFELPLRPCVIPSGSVFTPQGEFSLRGKRLQVIVKIAEIVLTPEKPQYNGGSWHVEGTAVEGIVATGIYYLANENLTDSKLAFRVMVTEPEYEQHDRVGVESLFGLESDNALTQDLGAVATSEDRCLVFPNVLQHKVLPFELLDKTKPGVRKILCFFLVDPSKQVPSTANVPPQQSQWIERAQREAFRKTAMGKILPEAMETNVMSIAQEGMTLEQAEAYRLELMDERSPGKFTEHQDWQFSLCEH